MQHSGGSTPELDSFWQEVLPEWQEMVPEYPWPKDQGSGPNCGKRKSQENCQIPMQTESGACHQASGAKTLKTAKGELTKEAKKCTGKKWN